MKYIRHDVLGVVLWPRTSGMQHAEVADTLFGNRCGQVVSAGFVTMLGDDLCCYGDSITLQLGGLPDDVDVLKKQLGIE